MNLIDEKIKEWDEYKVGTFAVHEWWIRTALQEAIEIGIDKQHVLEQQAYEKGTQEALAKVEEWARKYIDEMYTTCGTDKYNGGLEDLLHYLQKLKDNK